MQGEPEGPALLLHKLRGGAIDWAALEKKHTPKRYCYGPCMLLRLKEEYSAKEWKNKEDPHCKACILKLQEQGKTVRCIQCRAWCGDTDMPAGMMRNRTQSQFVCSTCQSKPNLRRCHACGEMRTESEYPATRWNQVLKMRSCFTCSQSRSCSACRRRDSKHKFPDDQWNAPDAERLCNDCPEANCRFQ